MGGCTYRKPATASAFCRRTPGWVTACMHARTGLCSLVYGLCSPTLSPAGKYAK